MSGIYVGLLLQGASTGPGGGAGGGPDAATLFYLTLLFIFLAAIVTTFVTRWSKDKCLAMFRGYHVTLTRVKGQTVWGTLKVFSSGLEVEYDAPYRDLRGHLKTSLMFYQPEIESGVLCVCRYHGELDEAGQRLRTRQVKRAFNPGPVRRTWRWIRNLVNTLRDAVNTAIGAAVNQLARVNPSSVLTTQTGSVTQIGQALVTRFGNAYEPLLEQYIGKPVIVDVTDPLNPAGSPVQFTGFLADYTQTYVAVLGVEHRVCERIEMVLPDVGGAEVKEGGAEARLEGPRVKVLNTRFQPMVVRRLEREGFEVLELGVVVGPNCVLELPVRDAGGAKVCLEVVEAVDVVAPRKWAVVRHAGTAIEPTGLLDEIHLDRLPLVPKKLVEVLRGEE